MNSSQENATSQLRNYLIHRKREYIERATTGPQATRLRHFRLTDTYEKRDYSEISGLCASGADLNAIEASGIACVPSVFWCPRLVGFFLDRGRDANSRDQNGETALNLALRYPCPSKPEIQVEYLLDTAKADPNVPNLRGETPILTLLNSSIVNKGPLVMKLMEKGADFGVNTKEGDTVLHRIAPFSDFELSPLLIDIFPGRVDSRNAPYAKTPLMIAAQCGNFNMCRDLLARGADLGATDLQGYTPLHHACLLPWTKLKKAEFLHRKAGKLALKSLGGRDCFELARISGNFDFMAEDDLETRDIRTLMVFKGVREILGYNDYEAGIRLLRFELGEIIAQFDQEHRGTWRLDGLKRRTIDLVIEHSTCSAKLWNLLALIPFEHREFVCEVLQYAYSKLGQQWPGSIEEFDLKTLCGLVQALEGDSYLTQVATKLGLNCLKLWVEKTGSNKLPSQTFYNLYVTLACQISQATDKLLLKSIISLDPRDEKGNSILHAASRDSNYQLIDTLINLSANIDARNDMGYTPFQLLHPENLPTGVVLCMLKAGAHLDAKNYHTGDKLVLQSRDNGAFLPYVTLQCLAARVIAQNPCRFDTKKLPKKITDFIREHGV